MNNRRHSPERIIRELVERSSVIVGLKNGGLFPVRIIGGSILDREDLKIGRVIEEPVDRLRSDTESRYIHPNDVVIPAGREDMSFSQFIPRGVQQSAAKKLTP